jgi:hypothetical protein
MKGKEGDSRWSIHTVWLHMIAHGYRMDSWSTYQASQWPSSSVEASSLTYVDPLYTEIVSFQNYKT